MRFLHYKGMETKSNREHREGQKRHDAMVMHKEMDM
jgi:hypothetical protein